MDLTKISLGGLFCTFLLWISIGFLFISAESGLLARSVVFGGLAWGSYLGVHWFYEGEIEDNPDKIKPGEVKNLFSGRVEFLGLVSALALFAVGGVLIALGVNEGSVLVAVFGAASCITGYMAVHYTLTGEPV